MTRSSLTNTRWPQPTAQYGQTLWHDAVGGLGARDPGRGLRRLDGGAAAERVGAGQLASDRPRLREPARDLAARAQGDHTQAVRIEIAPIRWPDLTDTSLRTGRVCGVWCGPCGQYRRYRRQRYSRPPQHGTIGLVDQRADDAGYPVFVRFGAQRGPGHRVVSRVALRPARLRGARQHRGRTAGFDHRRVPRRGQRRDLSGGARAVHGRAVDPRRRRLPGRRRARRCGWPPRCIVNSRNWPSTVEAPVGTSRIPNIRVCAVTAASSSGSV